MIPNLVVELAHYRDVHTVPSGTSSQILGTLAWVSGGETLGTRTGKVLYMKEKRLMGVGGCLGEKRATIGRLGARLDGLVELRRAKERRGKGG